MCGGRARARVCVCACVCVCVAHRSDWARLLYVFAFFLDRAREATRDRATHSNDCALPTAKCVAAVVVAAVAVVAVAAAARACVCVRAWHSLDRAREAARSRATHCIACALSAARRDCGGGGGGRGGGGGGRGGMRGGRVCARVCVCVCVCFGRAREATRHRATHISDCSSPARTYAVGEGLFARPPTQRERRGVVRREQARAFAGEGRQRPEHATMG